MRAIAPGKIVVSGAYSVLWGAPAVVTAVDRCVVADTSRVPDFVTAEVAAAVQSRRAPWFDASALRSGDRKLGLGSSAAIVVASLAALELEGDPGMDSEALSASVLPRALAAHREAQGGGSGIDVAASAFGATRRCVMRGSELVVEPYELPGGVAIVAYTERESSSTRGMVARVKAYAERDHGLQAPEVGASRLRGFAGWFARAEVRWMVVGRYAVGAHGGSRGRAAHSSPNIQSTLSSTAWKGSARTVSPRWAASTTG